ncbi:hypothetical protein C1646_764672 [Rhizophagus diaphanus]|nr:hypothetical protein C1646_764672 [Rhizophagus diaphanus] [Rhizophagus sp. MUCL 43196]
MGVKDLPLVAEVLRPDNPVQQRSQPLIPEYDEKLQRSSENIKETFNKSEIEMQVPEDTDDIDPKNTDDIDSEDADDIDSEDLQKASLDNSKLKTKSRNISTWEGQKSKLKSKWELDPAWISFSRESVLAWIPNPKDKISVPVESIPAWILNPKEFSFDVNTDIPGISVSVDIDSYLNTKIPKENQLLLGYRILKKKLRFMNLGLRASKDQKTKICKLQLSVIGRWVSAFSSWALDIQFQLLVIGL